MRGEKNTPVSPVGESDNTGEIPEASSPADNGERPSNNSKNVQFLHGILGLFTAPEMGPETEEEVKTRHELNAVVHRMLILGLALSTTVLFIGLTLSAITHQPVPSKVSSFREVYEGLRKGSPPSILSLGILLLIATPVLRVCGSLIEFIGKRDWRYTVITSLVLIILAISVFFGKG